MSDYVEARYAVLVIRQAHLSNEATARDLICKLVIDLSPNYLITWPQRDKKTLALDALRSLAVCFDQCIWPPASSWKVAHQAAQDWAKSANA